MKPGIDHTQRREYPFLQEFVKGHAGQDLHQPGLDIHRYTVMPHRARLLAQGNGAQLGHHVGQRGVDVLQVVLDIQAVGLRLGETAVGETCGMGHQLANGYRLRGRLGAQLALRATGDLDLQIGQLRQILAHRIIQLEMPFFVEHQQGRTGNRLGQRKDLVDGVVGERLLLLEIAVAGLITVDDLVILPYQRGDAGELFLGDLAMHRLTEHLQAGCRNLVALLALIPLLLLGLQRCSHQRQARCQAYHGIQHGAAY